MKSQKFIIGALFIISFLIPVSTKAATALSISCSPGSSEINSGDSVTWTGLASGGDDSYTYAWSDDDGNTGAGSTFTQSYSTEADNETTYKTAEVLVTDGLGATATASCDVTVIGQLTFNNCDPNEISGQIGTPIKWESDISGGIGPYTYSWSGDESLSGSDEDVYKTYSEGGTKAAALESISSSDGQTITGPFACSNTVEIFEEPEPLTFSSCSPNEASGLIDVPIKWNVSVSGGLGPYSYSWSGDDGLSGSEDEIIKSYDTAGTKTGAVDLIVSGDGQMLIGPFACSNTVEIFEVPETLSVSCSPEDSSIRKNNIGTWNSSISGGLTPYTISWTGTDDLEGSSESTSKTNSTTGDKDATILVVSGDGQMATANCGPIEVTSTSGGGSSRSRNDDEEDNGEGEVLGTTTGAVIEYPTPVVYVAPIIPTETQDEDTPDEEPGASENDDEQPDEAGEESEDGTETESPENNLLASAVLSFITDNPVWISLFAGLMLAGAGWFFVRMRQI